MLVIHVFDNLGCTVSQWICHCISVVWACNPCLLLCTHSRPHIQTNQNPSCTCPKCMWSYNRLAQQATPQDELSYSSNTYLTHIRGLQSSLHIHHIQCCTIMQVLCSKSPLPCKLNLQSTNFFILYSLPRWTSNSAADTVKILLNGYWKRERNLKSLKKNLYCNREWAWMFVDQLVTRFCLDLGFRE
jgi:hypothetical protein